MKGQLLGNTAILPAAIATARAIGGAAALPRAAVPLAPAAKPKGKMRRYFTAGGETAQVQHHKPITRKTREAYQAYLIRYGAEVREKLQGQGLSDEEIDRRVVAAVTAPPHKLERPKAGTTAIRGTALVDPSKLP